MRRNRETIKLEYQSYIRIVSSRASRSNDVSPNEESESPLIDADRGLDADTGATATSWMSAACSTEGTGESNRDVGLVCIGGVERKDSEEVEPLLHGGACDANDSIILPLCFRNAAEMVGSVFKLFPWDCWDRAWGWDDDINGGLKPFCFVGRFWLRDEWQGWLWVRRIPSTGRREDSFPAVEGLDEELDARGAGVGKILAWETPRLPFSWGNEFVLGWCPTGALGWDLDLEHEFDGDFGKRSGCNFGVGSDFVGSELFGAVGVCLSMEEYDKWAELCLEHGGCLKGAGGGGIFVCDGVRNVPCPSKSPCFETPCPGYSALFENRSWGRHTFGMLWWPCKLLVESEDASPFWCEALPLPLPLSLLIETFSFVALLEEPNRPRFGSERFPKLAVRGLFFPNFLVISADLGPSFLPTPAFSSTRAETPFTISRNRVGFFLSKKGSDKPKSGDVDSDRDWGLSSK